jgi:ribosome biogenesis protein Nip4
MSEQTYSNGKLASGNSLYTSIRFLIEESKQKVFTTVNAAMTILYWNIGKHINENIKADRATDYGKSILQTLSAKLSWSHIPKELNFQKYN